ncbi:MAG: ABC transporter ATP-binding protein [Alphaproteobacteria bacterium]
MSLLEVESLTVSLGGREILHNLTVSLDPGDVLGVVGESGSGKSMTAMAVMGLLPEGAKVSGRIHFDGRALHDLHDRELCALRGRDLAMVFQEPMTALNPLHRIGDQVAETIRIHTDVSRVAARERAIATLARVGLPMDRVSADRYPHELSGGQRQRVIIAMAIALKPKLMIADEPTTALDVTTQAQILHLLRRLVAEDGMSLVLISHDLAVVAGMASRVVIMKDGTIVESGETGTVFRTMVHPYTRRLFADSTHVPSRAPHTPGASPLLEVKNVVRAYGGARETTPRRAVDGVSFTLHKGENLGLVGESGCGKSTLARSLLGLEDVQSGEVCIDGVCMTAARGAALRLLRRRIQVVFQDPYGSFNPRHRVGRVVAEPFHLVRPRPDRAEIRDRVAAILTEVGLSPKDAERFPHEFSGGQRQRIALARAIVTEPDVIVLDEAVSALDVSVRARILDLLAQLTDRLGVSYLFISHDLSVVRSITDRVLVMRAGRIVEEGPTARVFSDPAHPYTASLIAAAPQLVLADEAGRAV